MVGSEQGEIAAVVVVVVVGVVVVLSTGLSIIQHNRPC